MERRGLAHRRAAAGRRLGRRGVSRQRRELHCRRFAGRRIGGGRTIEIRDRTLQLRLVWLGLGGAGKLELVAGAAGRAPLNAFASGLALRRRRFGFTLADAPSSPAAPSASPPPSFPFLRGIAGAGNGRCVIGTFLAVVRRLERLLGRRGLDGLEIGGRRAGRLIRALAARPSTTTSPWW